MRRAKLGDVYCVKVPNGYKLYQWAYSIPKKGEYIRVFPGLHSTIPDNVEQIVLSAHSYIISFNASRAYRIGLAQFVENIPVPDQYPFPKYQIRFGLDQETKRVDCIHVMNSDGTRDVWQWYYVGAMQDLPEEYRNVTLLNSCVTPNWLLYLFDTGFDLVNPERFFLGSDPDTKLHKYSAIVNEALTRHQTNSKP